MVLSQTQSYTPNVPEAKALSALNRYYRMTAEHLRRRYFGPGTLRYAQRAFKTLADNGFVIVREQTAKTRYGSGALVYYLAQPGRVYLQKKGIPVAVKKTPVQLQRISHKDLEHPLAITDFLIAADMAAEKYPDNLQIADMRNEQVLTKQLHNREPLPDSWIHFSVFDGRAWVSYPVVIEIDNETEYKNTFPPEKIEALLRWYETDYQLQFGTNRLFIAFVALTGKKRSMDIRLWTEQVLTKLGKRQLFSLFRFTGLHPATTDPYDMFFEPVWFVPFYQEPVSLFTELTGSP